MNTVRKLILAAIIMASSCRPSHAEAREYTATEEAAWAAMEQENHLADIAEFAAWDAENATPDEAESDGDFTDSGVGCADDCLESDIATGGN